MIEIENDECIYEDGAIIKPISKEDGAVIESALRDIYLRFYPDKTSPIEWRHILGGLADWMKFKRFSKTALSLAELMQAFICYLCEQNGQTSFEEKKLQTDSMCDILKKYEPFMYETGGKGNA